MLLTERATAITEASILGSSHPSGSSAAGELGLRICGGPRDGQTLRVVSDKCTIGSAPQCTLRLLAPGVRQVHCLILRNPKAAIVRCWSNDTRHNGQAFRDAALAVGDRLGVGPIELEVTALGGEPATSQEPAADAHPAPRAAVEQVADRCSEPAAIDQQLLAAAQVEFAAVRQQLSLQQQSIVEVQRTLAAQNEELIAQFRQHLAPGPAPDESHAELLAHAEALDRGAAQLDAQRRELTDFRDRLLHEQAELEAERQAFALEHARWQQQPRDPYPSVEDRPQPESDDDVFARLQRLTSASNYQPPANEPEWNREPPDTRTSEIPARGPWTAATESIDEGGSPSDSQDLPAADPVGERRQKARPGGESEELSIEEYMQQLLHRVRGGAASEGEPVRSEPREVVSKPVAPVVAPPVEMPLPPQLQASLSLRDIAPRSSAPEKADMAAMRDLANTQVRMALHTHSLRNTMRTARGKWGIAIASLAAAMFTLSFAPEGDWTLRVCALVALIISLFWGFQAWMSTQVAKDATPQLAASETLAAKQPAVSPPADASNRR